jgi:zinc protease
VKPLPDRGPKAVRQALPNGLVVIADRNPLAPEVEVRIEIAAGSAFELPEKSGVAGLTARLLSAGSAAHPEAEIVQAFEDAGARLDVSTGGARTVVRARMLAASLPALLPLLDQMVAAPAFPPEAFAREKAAAIADAKRRAHDPRSSAELLLEASIFPDKDPRGRDPLGDETSLGALTRADVGDFDRLNYRPDTTVVSVSGDVDPSEAIRQVTRAFHGWHASGKPPAPQPAGQIAALTMGWTGHAQAPGMNGTAVVVGWPGVARTDKDWLATRALGVVLDRRLGPSLKLPVDTTVEPGESPTAVLVHASIVPPAKPDEAAKTIGEAVAKLAADGVTADELALAKSILEGRFDRRLESNAGLAAFLAETERFKLGPDFARRYGAAVDALTADDLARVAKAQAGGAIGTVIVGP